MSSPAAQSIDTASEQRHALWILAGTMVLTFAIIYAIERFYDSYAVLDEYNTLFDTDPCLYLGLFGSGWGFAGFRHPLIIVFSILPRIVGVLLSHLFGLDAMLVRREMALLFVPAAEAAKSAFLFLIGRRLGLSVPRALLVVVLNVVAFSTITVGAVPESFPLSSLAIAIFLYLALVGIPALDLRRFIIWVACGALAIGVTTINVVPLAIAAFFGAYSCNRLRTAIWHAGRIVGASVLLCALLVPLLLTAYHYPISKVLPRKESDDLGVTEIGRHVNTELAVAFASTFAPVIPPVQELKSPELLASSTHKLMFSYGGVLPSGPVQIAWIVAMFALVTAGSFNLFRTGQVAAGLVIGSYVLLAFDFVLHHLFYGVTMYHYTQHWIVPMLVLLVGLLAGNLPKRSSWIGPTLVAALVLIGLAGDIRFLTTFSERLR